jgi:hypothetical protein
MRVIKNSPKATEANSRGAPRKIDINVGSYNLVAQFLVSVDRKTL